MVMPATPAGSHPDAAQQKIINDFQLLGSWDERYQYLIDLGRRLNRDNDVPRIEENHFYGCQANVWLISEHHNGCVKFYGNSDSLIVAGLMAIIFKVYSDRSAQEVVSLDPKFLTQTGLIDHLSTQRSTGLMNMIEHIRQYAALCIAQSKKGTI